jgi:hypothetical protein
MTTIETIDSCTVIKFPVATARLAEARLFARAMSPGDKHLLDGMIDQAIAERTEEPKFTLTEVQLRLEAQGQIIGHNERLRDARKDAWRKAETTLEYWRNYRQLHLTIGRACDCGVLDQLRCPVLLQKKHDFEKPWILDNQILGDVMMAERRLLLTPAPTAAALELKRKLAKKRWYGLDDGSIETEIERAIADDEAFLKAHPARQCKSNGSRRKK